VVGFTSFPPASSGRIDALQISSQRCHTNLIVRVVDGFLEVIFGTRPHHLCVSKKGRVRSAAISEGHPMARQAVLDSVQKWTFKPYRVVGRAKNVAADLVVNYDFRPPPPSSGSPH